MENSEKKKEDGKLREQREDGRTVRTERMGELREQRGRENCENREDGRTARTERTEEQ